MPLSKKRDRERMKLARLNGCSEKEKESARRWRLEHPEETRARGILRRAVLTGIVVKPTKCSACFKKGAITGHHEDYSKPLEVLWFCYSCHRKLHLIKLGKQRVGSNTYKNPLLKVLERK
jgi:hypothetical protein